MIKPEEGIVAAGAVVPAREAEAGPRRAVRSRAGQGGRRGPRRPIERLVQAGDAVLAVDLRGTGQTQPPRAKAAIIRPGISGCVRRLPVGPLVRRDAGGRRVGLCPICGRAGTGAGRHGRTGGHRQRRRPRPPRGRLGAEPVSARDTLAIARLLVQRDSQPLEQRVGDASCSRRALCTTIFPDLAATLGEKLAVEQPVNALGAVVQDSR